jgi:HSP20 family molecular chaperone IbpA
LWAAALVRLAQTDQLQNEAFRPTAAGWEPPVDVLETEDGLLIVVALPGVARDDMEIVIGNGELFVRGTRRWPGLRRPAKVHRLELPHGHFERRLPLPPGAYQLVGRDHEDGCLLLTLRRLD